MLSRKSISTGDGFSYPGVCIGNGKFIVIEGPDGVGRSTQIAALKHWLERKGYGVRTTDWNWSSLTRIWKHDEDAACKYTLDTSSLLYAADLTYALGQAVIPALNAGLLVLADRYLYTIFALAVVQGEDRNRIEKLLEFAPAADLVVYLRAGLEDLLPRFMNSGIFKQRDIGGAEEVGAWDFYC